MAKYIITLKPVSTYFFGQETTQVLGNKQIYYQHSADYPQQTALLGMLRFQLLKQEDLIPLHKNDNSSKAKELIGKSSFTVSNKGGKQSFGIIDKLSPLALIKNDDKDNPYFLFDKDIVKDIEQKEVALQLVFEDNTLLKGENTQTIKAPLLKLATGKTYLAKYPFVSQYKCLGLKTKVVNKANLFEPKKQIGIEKSENGQTKDEAFFKMEYKSLEKEWCFAFVVDIKETQDYTLKECDDFAILGKEQSVFKLKIEKIEEDNLFSNSLKKQSEVKEGLVKLIFLSDTLIADEKEFYKHCLFANIDTIHFRNITTTVSQQKHNYANKPNKSKGYNLIKRGSVVYTKNAEALTELITKSCQTKQFYKIGYNHFIIESSKTR